jgi:coiled-coil-helix-coiled-coil-helix domain-containing protein 2
MSNIVSTAAGVGIGHAIGHGLTGLWGGGSAASAAAPPAATTTEERKVGCDADAKAFTKCMDDYKGDMTACSWYLEQLKVRFFPPFSEMGLMGQSCQQMASQY